VRLTDAAGRDALMAAAAVSADRAAIVRELLARGADRARTDRAGLTALDLARRADNDDVAALLRKR
jgi:ankyrin repeat protein